MEGRKRCEAAWRCHQARGKALAFAARRTGAATRTVIYLTALHDRKVVHGLSSPFVFLLYRHAVAA